MRMNFDKAERLKAIGLIAAGVALVILVIWAVAVEGGKLTTVIAYNTGFWILLFVALVFGIFRKITNPKEFAWIELPAQLLASFVIITALYALFFSTSAKLTDTEVWNGYVEKAEYYEAWTEEVTYTEEVTVGTDKNGNTIYKTVTKKRHDHHPPEWKVVTTVGDFSTDKRTYQNYVGRFGNEKKKNLYRANQVSFGDGDMFYVAPGGQNDDQLLPATIEHYYVNYLKASDSIRKVSGAISGFQNYLLPYPRVYTGQFGPIEFDRVLVAGSNVPAVWQQTVNHQLDIALTSLGSTHQVNIVVYVVGTADQSFGYALEQAWVKGKKNDVIAVIGASQFPKIDFVYVMAWTKVEEFKIILRNRLLDLKDLSDGQVVAVTIIDQIKKSPNEGGFVRMPMADLEYLIADIKLPFWCQALIVLIGAAASYGVSVLLIRNQVKD